MMTIHHAKLPPDLVEDHRHGWNKISDQIQDWLTTRAQRQGDSRSTTAMRSLSVRRSAGSRDAATNCAITGTVAPISP